MKTVPVETLQLPPDVLKALREDQEVILLTDQGKPLARVLPLRAPTSNPLKDSIVFETDLISPIDERWSTMLGHRYMVLFGIFAKSTIDGF